MAKTWKQRIAAARKNEGFTDDDKNAAGEWATCAVGEYVGQYQYTYTKDDLEVMEGTREEYSEPKLGKLERLGILFSEYVSGDSINEAKETYKKITAHFAQQTARRKVRKEAKAAA